MAELPYQPHLINKAALDSNHLPRSVTLQGADSNLPSHAFWQPLKSISLSLTSQPAGRRIQLIITVRNIQTSARTIKKQFEFEKSLILYQSFSSRRVRLARVSQNGLESIFF